MSEQNPEQIASNYQRVRAEIDAAAEHAGRDPAAVRLVVVTKGHPIETLQAVLAAGAQYLGESYLDEAQAKVQTLGRDAAEWHMIGHVQSRKARGVCEHFSWVQSLDSLKLARRYSGFAQELGLDLQVLLQVNVSGEASKSGWPLWDQSRWPDWHAEVAELTNLPNLQVRGLMTMPPYHPDPQLSRPYFRRMVRLQAHLAAEFPATDWSELSMGMSGDYAVAVEDGATIVRVGTAIVGSRSYS